MLRWDLLPCDVNTNEEGFTTMKLQRSKLGLLIGHQDGLRRDLLYDINWYSLGFTAVIKDMNWNLLL